MASLEQVLREYRDELHRAANTARVLHDSGQDLTLSVFDAADLHGVDKRDLLLVVEHSKVGLS